jgi:hypothetical protein
VNQCLEGCFGVVRDDWYTDPFVWHGALFDDK